MAIRINDTSSILSHIKRSRPYKVSRPHRRRCILLPSGLLASRLLPSSLLAILLPSCLLAILLLTILLAILLLPSILLLPILLLAILLPLNLLLGGLRLWVWAGVGV